MHPKHVSLLSDEVLWGLIAIMTKALEWREVPTSMLSLHMRLLGKTAPDGSYKGERAVGLFSTPVRVFLRAIRRNVCASWMRKILPSNWYGTEARAPERAVWVHSTATAFAKARGRKSSAVLFDVTKAFDHLRWGHLIRAARKRGFPMDLLALLHSIHTTNRLVVVDGVVVDDVQPNISVVAGCACADLMMLLVMLDIDEDVKREEPGVMTAVVADDYQVLAVDDVKPIAMDSSTIGDNHGMYKARDSQTKMVAAVNATVSAFRRAHLPVADDKLVALASTRQLEKDLAVANPALAKSIAKQTRNLGIDFTLSGYRKTPTSRPGSRRRGRRWRGSSWRSSKRWIALGLWPCW